MVTSTLDRIVARVFDRHRWKKPGWHITVRVDGAWPSRTEIPRLRLCAIQGTGANAPYRETWRDLPDDFNHLLELAGDGRSGVRLMAHGPPVIDAVVEAIDAMWLELFPRPLPTFRIRRDARRLSSRRVDARPRAAEGALW